MRKIFIVLLGMCYFGCVLAKIPSADDLMEAHDVVRLKRDMSMPHSRIVVNYYDFDSKLTEKAYSDNETMPLNVAWLSTQKNIPGKDPKTRFSRTIPELLMIFSADISLADSLNRKNSGAADSFKTQWKPYQLPFSAQYANGMEIAGYDFFYDEKTLVRHVSITHADKIYVAGKYKGYTYLKENSLFVNDKNIRYAISINSTEPLQPVYKNNAWILPIEMQTLKNGELIISVSFADSADDEQHLLENTRKPIVQNDIQAKLDTRKSFWNEYLKRVPHPKNFNLTSVDAKGITSDQLRAAYYKAWIFLAQNVLPADKTMYPYPQICTGKPSLWDEGDKLAPFSAAWESLIAMQFYAYIDSETAKEAFKGMMSLVDDAGLLSGESLPSRKAQTAMLLYRFTKDKNFLKEIYPPLNRYMEWRMVYPHWVYGKIKPTPAWKDAEFVFSALIDMEYMVEIAIALGRKSDASYWEKRRKEFYRQSLPWFWETPASFPVQEYYTDTKVRVPRNTVWVTTVLYSDLLEGEYLKSTMERFLHDFDPGKPFAGFSEPKYPDISYTVYGLLKRGEYRLAEQMMEAVLRDIIREGGSFAEVYTPLLEPLGVRPSLFGAFTLIDYCLLLNGYKYDRGKHEKIVWRNKSNYGINNIFD